jgi:hypothetical protein
MELVSNDKEKENDKLIICHETVRSLNSKRDELSAIFEKVISVLILLV